MCEFLKLEDYKDLLRFYKKKIPNNIFFIKKKAIKLLIKKMCRTNCVKNKKYKLLLYLCYIRKAISDNKKAISDNKKNRHSVSKKLYVYKYKNTRIQSPI